MTNAPVASIAHLLGRPQKNAKKPSPQTETNAQKPTPRALPAKKASAKPVPFGHLEGAGQSVAVAPDSTARKTQPAPKPAVKTLADEIIAAAEKSKTPTGTNVPQPTGVAAAIIAAGKKRRGEKS